MYRLCYFRQIAELAKLKGENGQKYLDIYEAQKKLVNTIAWDGEWYRRCITDEGKFIGSKSEPQAKIWLNTQSWSVISGMGDNGKTAMDSVAKYLDTPLGIKKIHPAMTTDYPTKDGNLTMYNKGCGENGSVGKHTLFMVLEAVIIYKKLLKQGFFWQKNDRVIKKLYQLLYQLLNWAQYLIQRTFLGTECAFLPAATNETCVLMQIFRHTGHNRYRLRFRKRVFRAECANLGLADKSVGIRQFNSIHIRL